MAAGVCKCGGLSPTSSQPDRPPLGGCAWPAERPAAPPHTASWHRCCQRLIWPHSGQGVGPWNSPWAQFPLLGAHSFLCLTLLLKLASVWLSSCFSFFALYLFPYTSLPLSCTKFPYFAASLPAFLPSSFFFERASVCTIRAFAHESPVPDSVPGFSLKALACC